MSTWTVTLPIGAEVALEVAAIWIAVWVTTFSSRNVTVASAWRERDVVASYVTAIPFSVAVWVAATVYASAGTRALNRPLASDRTSNWPDDRIVTDEDRGMPCASV